MIGYILASPKAGEGFTEFYILGHNGKANDYPTEFIMAGDKVILVSYGDCETQETDTGRVIVGIVNREHEEADYSVRVLIDGKQSTIYSNGDAPDELGPIKLAHEEKWEQEIGFTPENVGNNQKVEFVLYKDGTPYFEEQLYLWIDVNIQS